jgi:endonuclease-8
MPEGPEMYRTARQVAGAVGDGPLTEVWFAFEALQPWSERLTGQALERVETLGKALLLRFADGTTIYTHNQLYGRWMFAEAGRRPDTNRQLRLALSTDEHSALLYSASEIQVIEPGRLAEHPFIARAGLDILSSGADIDRISKWIGQPRFARKRLGHLLLDQGFLAGVGNYLRSEILHVSGLHWQLRPGDLDGDTIRRLAGTAHTLMWRSAETGGLTNDPDRVAELKRAGWPRRDYRHFVFGRDGQVCHACDTPIERTTVSGRRLYHCPSCQAR